MSNPTLSGIFDYLATNRLPDRRDLARHARQRHGRAVVPARRLRQEQEGPPRRAAGRRCTTACSGHSATGRSPEERGSGYQPVRRPRRDDGRPLLDRVQQRRRHGQSPRPRGRSAPLQRPPLAQQYRVGAVAGSCRRGACPQALQAGPGKMVKLDLGSYINKTRPAPGKRRGGEDRSRDVDDSRARRRSRSRKSNNGRPALPPRRQSLHAEETNQSGRPGLYTNSTYYSPMSFMTYTGGRRLGALGMGRGCSTADQECDLRPRASIIGCGCR